MQGVRLAACAVLFLLLSGCFGKDKLTEDEMERRAADALTALEADIGPEGRIQAFAMVGSVTIEAPTPAGVFPVSVQATATVTFGTDSDVRVDGKVARVQYSVYCDPSRFVVVTDGFEDYGERDENFEARNPAGACTGRDAEPLLAGLGDLDFADPALLTGHFDPAGLDLVGVEKTGKTTFDAVYRSQGSAGATDITVHLKGHDIQSFTVENPESRLTLTPTYGARDPVSAPIAEARFAAPVTGTGESSTAGYEWIATRGSGGALDEYSFRVYESGGSVPCTGGSVPLVVFDLGDGDVQTDGDWRFTFQDDGDGELGRGDWALIQHPDRGDTVFDGRVVVWDDWADAQTSVGCSVPGPGFGLGLAGLLGAFAVVRVRRRA